MTQILWRSAASLAHAGLGELDLADRLSVEAIEVASTTDSMDSADAWEARARVLVLLDRKADAMAAAKRARELHVAKGAVNLIRRIDQLATEIEAGPIPG